MAELDGDLSLQDALARGDLRLRFTDGRNMQIHKFVVELASPVLRNMVAALSDQEGTSKRSRVEGTGPSGQQQQDTGERLPMLQVCLPAQVMSDGQCMLNVHGICPDIEGR